MQTGDDFVSATVAKKHSTTRIGKNMAIGLLFMQ